MRVVICRGWGGIETLTVEDVAPPTPERGQVLIDVTDRKAHGKVVVLPDGR
jgi:NADPH:quinone reductase-like Zn-dependent oxidoreductase